ncbi:hypothetical protein CPC08DRAFT_766582 [Agrocybe pediades]|nr:hypothetical protein CPC08DRAFT_766582 [Agrocybe pediades]
MLPPGTMISSNQGVLITGGQFHQYNNYHSQTSLGNKAPIDILTEAVAPNALHNSGATFDKPKCHPRTRVKIREIIMRWILLGRDGDDQAGKQFMWLNGAAGCGKSAIAQSTIESCIGQRLLLASFFFNRSDATRNHAGSFVATLAYQLYCAFPETEVQTEILSTIKKDPLVFKKTLQEQFTSLIVQPLRAHFSKDQSAQLRVPFLIVIDGLDECIDRNAQKAILTGLAESLHNSNLCIPVFVASRPEHDIKLSFSSKYLMGIHTRMSLDLEDEDDADDIRLYLFDRFAEIKDDFDNRTIGRKLAQDWPGDEVIETLVWKSSRHFVYASTVIRYVESTRHRPDHRLDVALNLRRVNARDYPFAELDELYTTILEAVSDIEKVLHVLSLHLMNGPSICVSVIEKMLSYDEGEVETLFCDMGALVQVYKDVDQSYLRFLHASFREYLVDTARSKQFHIDMDYETIKHIPHVLQYLASCCSSSFDPNSNAGTPMYMFRHINFQVAKCMGQIEISLELQQALLSFPLEEFLKPHSTSSGTYWRQLEYFITPFLELLEAMVINDPTLSYIQDHQLGILRSVIMEQIRQYFNDDNQAATLVLFYHMGSHRFVPVLDNTFYCSSSPFHLVHSSGLRGDTVYHSFVRQLLRDTLAGQSGERSLGPIINARAALACFKELAEWAPLPLISSWKNIDIVLTTDSTEDDAHQKLTFWPVTDNTADIGYANLVFDSPNGGLWRFTYTEQFLDSESYPLISRESLRFLLLGYLIFILPRCGRSDALVAACKDYIRLPDNPKSYLQFLYNFFPTRTRLWYKEMINYLARVSPNT